VYRGNIEEVAQYIDKLLEDPNSHGFGYGIHDRESVNYGFKHDVNLFYCMLHGIEVFNIKRSDGCIVAQRGDLSFIRISKNKDEFHYRFIEFLCEKLNQIGIPATTDRNDLMVEDLKVAGCTSFVLPDGRTYYAMHVSININLEHIKYICMKPMKKTPAGLSQ
jgi:lipoate-protein ligase A